MFSDPTFWVGLAFVIFIAIIFYYKVPGLITGALDQRAEKISAELDEARRLREEAQALLANYERKHRDAMKEADEMVAHAQKEAERESQAAAERLERSIAAREQQALDKIALAEAQAEKEVRDAAVDVAVSAARQVIAEHVGGDQGNALIDQSIKDLRRHLN